MLRVYQPSSPIHWNWMTLSGPDAQDFLHRLTTTHVRALQPGKGAGGCFLTAQGKIRSLFTLWNLRPGEYSFEFDAGADGKWKRELLTAIEQFTFSEKFTLNDEAALSNRWLFPQDALPGINLLPGETVETPEGLRFCHHGELDFGIPWITAWGSEPVLKNWLDRAGEIEKLDFDLLENWRIHALRPRIGAEITDSTIPLEVGLRDHIATAKGCYPGQEVIERIAALGAPARRLALIQGDGPAPKPGDLLLNLADPAAEVGQVTSSVSENGKFSALGFVRKIHAKEGMQVNIGTIVRVAPYA